MKEMLGVKLRQACYGCDEGGAPSYTRLTSSIPKTLKTYRRIFADPEATHFPILYSRRIIPA
jgi:hypothetical protein